MSETITVGTTTAAAFPQTAGNRTCKQIVEDIANYVGGDTSDPQKARIKTAFQSAVRSFNTWAWKFNRIATADTSFVADTTDYQLPTDFRNPLRCTLIDINGRDVFSLEWRHFKAWVFEMDTTVASSQIPTHYTVKNVHQTGLISFFPRIGTGGFSFPKFRVDYHRRILVPNLDDDLLNVPLEVEEAIYQEGISNAIAMTRSFAEATTAYTLSSCLAPKPCWLIWADTPRRMLCSPPKRGRPPRHVALPMT